MINCKYILVCENVIVDSISKATSLINIVNGIKIPKTPASIPIKFMIHTTWGRNEKATKDDMIQLTIKQPASDVEEVLAEAKIPGSSLNHNHNFSFLGLKVNDFGSLYFIAKIKEGENFCEAGRCKFRIDKAS
jgi:hypothetical protein